MKLLKVKKSKVNFNKRKNPKGKADPGMIIIGYYSSTSATKRGSIIIGYLPSTGLVNPNVVIS